jgi:hypothetical protein
MAAKARIQVNLAVNKLEEFGDMSKINDTVFPILWFEEGVDELGEEILTMLKFAAVAPQMYKKYILYVLVGLGSAETILFILALTSLVKRSALKMELPHNPSPFIHGDNSFHSLKALLQGGDQFELILPNIPNLSSDSSTDSLRATSSDHSRNSSQSSNIPYFISMTNAAFTNDNGLEELDNGPKCLLSPNAFVGVSGPPKSQIVQECIDKQARRSS